MVVLFRNHRKLLFVFCFQTITYLSTQLISTTLFSYSTVCPTFYHHNKVRPWNKPGFKEYSLEGLTQTTGAQYIQNKINKSQLIIYPSTWVLSHHCGSLKSNIFHIGRNNLSELKHKTVVLRTPFPFQPYHRRRNQCEFGMHCRARRLMHENNLR